MENRILGEPQLRPRTCRALLLTASRRLESAPLSQTFGTCYGFCGSPQNELRGIGEPHNLPGEGPSTPSSPFSLVDSFRLLTGPFDPGCPSYGKCNCHRWYVVTRSHLNQPASPITADRLATPETNRSSLATHTAQVNNRDKGRIVILPKMVKSRLSGVIFKAPDNSAPALFVLAERFFQAMSFGYAERNQAGQESIDLTSHSLICTDGGGIKDADSVDESAHAPADG